MELFFGIVAGLLILVFLVVIHELGHAVAAYRSGVGVEEFGIGFPPRAWSKKLKNGVVFSVNWLPLGGFVRLQGEHDAADKKGDYGAATFWQKTRILLAGVAVNWIAAAVLLTLLAWTGLPKVLPDQFTVAGDTRVESSRVKVTNVIDNSPAQKAGLKTGDMIVSIANMPIGIPADLSTQTSANKGKTVAVEYIRGDTKQTVNVPLNADTSKKQGYLGVSTGQSTLLHVTWSAPIVGVATAAQLTWMTLDGLADLVGNVVGGLAGQLSFNESVRSDAQANLASAGDSVAGPIGIIGMIFPAAAQAGVTQLVFLTAIISLTLAVMNVLPIPALDGGRWFVTAGFRLFKKELTKEREEKIQAAGFVSLMLLVLLTTVVDVRRFL